jgi:hypothetical protein
VDDTFSVINSLLLVLHLQLISGLLLFASLNIQSQREQHSMKRGAEIFEAFFVATSIIICNIFV